MVEIALQDLPKLTQTLSTLLQSGETIGLIGDLGTGKTTFTKHLASHFGIDPSLVTSPTYVYHQIYQGSLAFHHMDLYRIKDESLLQELGLPFALETHPGICVVEWVDLFPHAFDRVLDITLHHSGPEKRKISFQSYANFQNRVLQWEKALDSYA